MFLPPPPKPINIPQEVLDRAPHHNILEKHYGKDWKRIYKAFKSTPPMKLPLPLVVRDKNSDNYLLAGNTRLMVSVSLGYNMGINVIPYKYEFKSEGFYL